MAPEKDDNKKTLPVAADYSAAGVQYRLMEINSSKQWVLASVLGQKVFGPLLDKPDLAGRNGIVAVALQSKVRLGATVAPGALLVSDATARAITKNADNQYVFGRAITGGAVGQVIDFVFVQFLLSDTSDATMIEDFSKYGGTDKGLAMLQSDGTAYDKTAGVLNTCYFGDGTILNHFGIVEQTLPPAMTATGLNIAGDQTDNDGLELYGGLFNATGRPLEIGRDRAFYFALAFAIADVSGTDDFHVGFRRATAPLAAYDDYVDSADLAIITNASPAAIYTSTILNAGATAETDTTDTLADGVATVWKILVSAAGVVTFQIDGAAPTAVGAFTFDDGDLVVPFVHLIQHGDLTEALTVTNWTVDYQ